MRGKRGWGEIAERYAIKLLEKNGYEILQKNFRNRFGEIDIIAKDGDTLVFVEVKARSSRRFGLPQEAVTKRKLFTIKKVGEYFLLTNPGMPEKQRIDVVALEISNGSVVSSKIIKVI